MESSQSSRSLHSPLCDVTFGSFMSQEVYPFLKRAHFHPSYPALSLFLCRKRQQPLSPRLFGWLTSVFTADYRRIKNINGLDCYFFVRFLRMMVRVMLPIWLLSWAVLLPLTSVNTGVAGHSGLDMFIFGNIAPTDQSRYAGQLLVTWISTSKSHASHPAMILDISFYDSMDLVEYQT